MQAERTSTLTSTFADGETRGRQRFGRLRLMAFSSVTLLLAVLIEVMFWLCGAFIAYCQVPESVAAIRSHGVEAPRSMVRALNVADWIYESWRIAIPLIAAGIVAPKLVLFSSTESWQSIASILIGWAVPLLFLYYLLGTPTMLKLGIWP